MSSYGQVTEGTVGSSCQVSSDGRPEFKAAGLTIDWATVAAAAADVTWEDAVLLVTGAKGLRYGQVVALIGAAEVQTLTFTGGPTSGSAVVTLPTNGTDPAQVAAGIAFNATAQVVQDTLNALGRLSPNGVSVARSGAGSAGDPYVYTITFNRNLGNVPQFTSTHTFAGGTTPTTTHATTTAGSGTGLYGPYDSAASDGRQTLARGNCFILNESVLELDMKSDHPPALDGGRVFKSRILAVAAGPSLADGPTFAALEAALPRLSYVAE